MKSLEPSAHSKYEHVFIVLRIDDSQVSSKVEDTISAVSVFRDSDAADAEARRLNDLSGEKGSRYLVLISRLKDEPKTSSDSASTG